MITEGDFSNLLSMAELEIFGIASEMMASYSLAQVAPREEFTKKILQMLNIVTGNRFNESGSFTKDGAENALRNESSFLRSNFELMIRLHHRLLQLEKGEVNYAWLEKSWSSYRKLLYAKGHRRLAASISRDIKAGAHNRTAPPRPYMGHATQQYAPIMAENINQLLLEKLPIRRV